MLSRKKIKLFCFILFLSALNLFADKKELGILLIGETGTGKSTCVNFIYNLILGRDFDDPRDIVVPLLDGQKKYHVNIEEYKKYNVEIKKSGSSQTKKVNLYTAENEKYKVNIWDTPGFQDTENSAEREDMTTKEIVEAFVSTLNESNANIHAILVVMKATSNRLSKSLLATMKSIKTMLPSSVKDNIVALYTYPSSLTDDQLEHLPTKFLELSNLDSYSACDADRSTIDKCQVSPVFTLEARPFFSDASKIKRSKQLLNIALWEEGRETVDNLLDLISSFSEVDGEGIHNIATEREAGQNLAEETMEKLLAHNKNKIALADLIKELERAEKDVSNYENYEKTETRTRLSPRLKGCKWYQIFCSPSVQYKRRTYEVTIVDEEMKKRFEDAESSVTTNKGKIDFTKNEIAENEKKRKELTVELCKNQKQLEQDAWDTDKNPYIVKLESLIEAAKVNQDDDVVSYYDGLVENFEKLTEADCHED